MISCEALDSGTYDDTMPEQRTVAYWYPEPYWSEHEASAVKNLLPFFDEVAILLPDYMLGRHRDANPWLAGPLEDLGLLRILEPGAFVDQEMTTRLHAIVSGLVDSGAFNDLDVPSGPYGYHELSRTRLGWNADLALSTELIEMLQDRQLALPSADGVSVPLHPAVRTAVLVVLSQLAPAAGRLQGVDLLPVTGSRDRVRDLVNVLGLPSISTAGQVVAMDAEVVGLDLQSAPLDEVLDFREHHGDACRRYIRQVRQFGRTLSSIDSDNERTEAILDRQADLADLAADLRRTARTYWKRPVARVAVGGVGAVLSLASGSVFPAALGSFAALLEWDPRPDTAGPFSYLFEVHRSLGT